MKAKRPWRPKRSDLHNLGSLITFTDPEDKQEHCLGYLIDFKDHGVFEPNYGKVPVKPEEVDPHNTLLSQAEIEGLDKNCEVGMSGSFYYGNGQVRTFTGTVVSEDVEVNKAKTITFRRNGMTFRGKLEPDSDLFFFERVADDAKGEKDTKPDLVGRIMDYESGQMDDQETVEFFQDLIDSGLAWQLQGSYGRMAEALIEQGQCHRRK